MLSHRVVQTIDNFLSLFLRPMTQVSSRLIDYPRWYRVWHRLSYRLERRR